MRRFLRISLLVPEWEAALESDDVDIVFSTLFGLLETGFEFYDAHSRIVTPDPSHEETQSELTCYMGLLEPFRDLENATLWRLCPFL